MYKNNNTFFLINKFYFKTITSCGRKGNFIFVKQQNFVNDEATVKSWKWEKLCYAILSEYNHRQIKDDGMKKFHQSDRTNADNRVR